MARKRDTRRTTQKATRDREAPQLALRSAVKQAVHGVFNDLRCEPRLPQGDPFVATLSGMRHSGRSSAVATYVFRRAAEDAMEQGLFPVGTTLEEVRRKQDLVVDIAVAELLAAMPPFDVAEALRRPASWLRKVQNLVRHGSTELVLLEGVDELLQRAIDAHGDKRNLDIALGMEAAKGFACMVGIPIVHVCEPSFRKMLSDDVSFARTWRWELDLFALDENEEAHAAYMIGRFEYFGLTEVERKASPIKPDPVSGNMPGLVFNSRGAQVGVVSAPALAEAVKSCGPGSVGFVVDIWQGTSFAALLTSIQTPGELQQIAQGPAGS